MKIRSGWVSNSSSSSFVIALPKPIEKYSYKDFLKAFNLPNCDESQLLYRDLNFEDNTIMRYLSNDIDNIIDKLGMSDEKLNEKLKTDLQKAVHKTFNKFGKNLYYLTYEDNYEMEYNFVPTFEGTVSIINNH